MAFKQQEFRYQDFVQTMGELLRFTDAATLPKLIAAFGDCDYLLRKSGMAISTSWKKQINQNVVTLDAAELNWDQFVGLCTQKTLFDTDALYVISRVEKRADFATLLATINGQTALTSHLLLLIGQESPAAKVKTELGRLSATMIPCVAPIPAELPKFVMGLAKRYQVTFDAAAAQLLLEAVGSDLDKIENEVNLASLIFAGQKQPILSQDLAPHLSMLREDHIFQIDQHLLNGNFGLAQALVTELLRRGETALALVGVIARHCRNALKILEATKRSLPPNQIAGSLYLPLSVVKSYTRYVTRHNVDHFARGLDLCGRADSQLKTSRLSEDLVLGQLLAHLGS